MRSYAFVYWLLLCTFVGTTFGYEWSSVSILNVHTDAGRDNVSLILANLDDVPSTFEIENIGMEDGDVFVSTTVDPKQVQLYVLPREWNTGNSLDAVQLDITTDGTRLEGQIMLTQQPKVLIQLNNVLHTPGDYVTFRILLTDELNRPLASTEQPFNMTINLVHETQHTVRSLAIQLHAGSIYSYQHLLKDNRDLGEWKITVTIGEETTSKRFQVVLHSNPIHKIALKTGRLNTIRDEALRINVEALYTFGKPIRGMLTLHAGGDRTVEHKSAIDGSKIVTIPMEELLTEQSRNGVSSKTIRINATVATHNGLTGRSYHQSKTIPVYVQPYKIVLEPLVDFKAGQNVTVLVRAVQANGDPLDDIGSFSNRLSVSVRQETEETVLTNHFKQLLNDDGTAVLMIPTHEFTENLTVRVQYREVKASLVLEPLAYIPRLHVHFKTASSILKQSEGFTLTIASSHPMDTVLAVVHLHSGVNVPLMIDCSWKNYHEQYISQRVAEVRRVYVFARFDEVLVQASTPYLEAPMRHVVHLAIENSTIKVRTKEHSSRVGIAVYEGLLDAEQLENIYAHGMFNGTVYPETQDVKPLNEVIESSPPEKPEDGNDNDVKLNSNAPIINRVILWQDKLVRKHEATFHAYIPPHVNQWTVSAFAFSPTAGLGIAEPVQWHRKQDIEIYLHVPYSAKKLEEVTVDVYIVNNVNRQHSAVLVELLNTANEFHFLNNDGRIDAIKKTVLGRLKPYEVQRAEFLIRPKKVGSITITANAYAQDIVVARAEKILRTIPESLEQTDEIMRMFSLDNSEQNFDNIKLTIPHQVDAGSEKIIFSLHEQQQTSASFLVNLLLDRLVQADPFTTAIKAALTLEVLALGGVEWTERSITAADLINQSVRKILSYANEDGSFTIPDDHAPASACWDTVISLQALTFANKQMETVELEGAIRKTLDWLKHRQNKDGGFCADDQANGVEITAHILMTFMNAGKSMQHYVTIIDSMRNYLLSSTSGLKDPYLLALVGHVLQQSAKSVTREQERALIDVTLTYIVEELFQQKKQNPSKSKMWWSSSTVSDMDVTSYALMFLSSKRFILNAGPTVNWIKRQPFRRTEPTITPNSHLALRALIEYAKRTIFLREQYMATIVATNNTHELLRHQMTHENTEHVIDLPANTRSVSFSIKGTVTGAFVINYSYLQSVTTKFQKFNINVQRYESSNEDYTDWKVCIRFMPKGTFDKTNMVSCEISFPTGYIVLDDSVDEINDLADVVSTALRNDETLFTITFEEIGVMEKCFNVTGFRRNVETRRLPGMIRVFDVTDANNVAFTQFDTQT
uniref:Alpha-2-macroglobulin domain-containing protein n=1 Tax=Anopheles farauti TaxID=69004 RepID=A0A182QNI5_9DIPT